MSVLWSGEFTEGGFATKFISGTTLISSGSSGTLLTITPPSGQKVRITYLTMATVTTQPNINLRIGGVNVATGITLRHRDGGFDNGDANFFKIGGRDAPLSYLEGESDEAIDIVLTTGTTAAEIQVMYMYGE